MKPGETLQMSAEVTGSNVTQHVFWRVEGAASTNTTISENGLLSVGRDETAASLTVIAVSGDDTGVQGSFTVTVRTGGGSETPPPESGSSETPSQGGQSGTASGSQNIPATGANSSIWLMIAFLVLAFAAAGSVMIEQRRRSE